MKAFGVALIVWTLLAFGFVVVFLPGNTHNELLSCMRLVGRSLKCEAGQAAINEAVQGYRTIPMLAGVAAGYLGIVALRITRTRSRVRPRQSPAH